MWTHLLTALAFCGAIAILAEPVVAKAPAAKVHTGMVVSAGMGKLTMKSADGKEHSHDIDAAVMITVHGKPGKLEDLKAGEKIRVTSDGGGKVTAVSTIDVKKQK
jgi:hypothetical protein